jgi:hypothetical protein
MTSTTSATSTTPTTTSDEEDVRSWRMWTLAVGGWTLFAVIVGGVIIGRIADPCDQLSGIGLQTCASTASIGSVVATLVVFAIWLLGVLVLSVGWLARRPARRLCPPYGHVVPQGSRTCRTCGYDFITGTLPPIAARAAPSDPGRPGPGA